MIRLNVLNKFYNRGKQNEIHVLDNINLELPDSGMWAIFGPSGCGKTTLLNVIGGMDDLASGEVSIDGQTMMPENSILRNRDVGIIFQNYNLNRDETVFENVADALRLCGMRDEAVIKERVEAALGNVGMAMFAKRLPDTLSGGQQQRVAIARAIVKNPKVILADEPTGNLDETNTILVMDILKEMSKEHLVVLVTHEANLVDYYCDTVVELKDGRVVGVRTNESANGYVARDKSDIFLGELDQRVHEDGDTEVAFYGEKPEVPLKLTVVNHNGRMFLRIDTPKVTVLDDTSEVKLREGVYTERVAKERKESSIDMSKLPPIEGEGYGRLFRLKSSIVNGYRTNYRSLMKKKSKRRLGICLGFFGMVIVFLTAVFSRGIQEFTKVKEQYDDRVFFVTAASEDISDRIRTICDDPASGVDEYSLRYDFYVGDDRMYAYLAAFETAGFHDVGFDNEVYIGATACVFSDRLSAKDKCIAGKTAGLANDEIVITQKVADVLLENSPYRYVRDYTSLLSLMCAVDVSNTRYRIVGITDADEMAAYLAADELDYVITSEGPFGSVMRDPEGYFHVAEGECVVIRHRYKYQQAAEMAKENELKVGETVIYNGIPLKVAKVYDVALTDEEERLIYATDADEFYDEAELREDDELSADTKNEDDGQTDTDEPDFSERKKKAKEKADLRDDVLSHFSRFDQVVHERFFVVNASDYSKGARVLSTNSICIAEGSAGAGGTLLFDPNAGEYSYNNDEGYRNNRTYYQLHSTDPEKTEAYLRKEFGSLKSPVNLTYDAREQSSAKAIYTPDDRFDKLFENVSADVWELFIAWAVVLGLMCVCMFFIMKSNIMNRSREIGIYRAIGVSRKNILFRFAVETGVVVTFSVFIGYLISSAIVRFIISRGGMVEGLLHYPLWLALLVLVFLYAVCILAGIVPVIGLLRKSPSEILAKYDI